MYIERMICSAALGMSLFCVLGSRGNAASPCLTEVLSEKKPCYVEFDGNDTTTKLDFPLNKGFRLPSTSTGTPKIKDIAEGDSKGKLLTEALQISLVPKTGRHVLKRPLAVWTGDGKRYLLRAGTSFQYTLPDSEAEQIMTIPKGTALIEVDAAEKKGEKDSEKESKKEYELAEALTVEISPPNNRELTVIVDSRTVADRIPGSGNAGTTLDIIPKRAPVNGYVTLTLEKSGFDFSKAQFHVCLKKHGENESRNDDGGGDKSEKYKQRQVETSVLGWLDSDDVELKTVEAGKAQLRVRIPEINEGSVRLAKRVVLLVAARDQDGKLAEAVSREFSVSSRGLAVFVWLAALAIPWLIAGLIVGSTSASEQSQFKLGFQPNPIWFVAGKYGGASLSLAQILLWTVLVFSASFYVLIISGSLLDLTPEVLMLLGITGGSSVIAKITASVRDEKGREISAAQPRDPRWMDLFRTDGRPDLYKVQMALFTTLAAVFVTARIYATLEFPVLPAGLLTLIGISNGVYIAAKATSKTVYEKLADKANEKQQAEDELAKQTAEADEADKQLQEAKKEVAAAIAARDATQAEFDKEEDAGKKTKLNTLLEQQKATAGEAEKRAKEAEQKKKESDDSKNAAKEKLDKAEKEFTKVKKEIDAASD